MSIEDLKNRFPKMQGLGEVKTEFASDAVLARMVKLESALRFYADSDKWASLYDSNLKSSPDILFEDRGAKAREALTIDEVGESKSYEYNQYFQNMTKEGLLGMIESYLKCERRLK